MKSFGKEPLVLSLFFILHFSFFVYQSNAPMLTPESQS